MTAAMLVPMLAPVALVELGVVVPGLTEGSQMVLSHVAMIGGMVALMVYRFDRYAHGSHDDRPERAHHDVPRGSVGTGREKYQERRRSP